MRKIYHYKRVTSLPAVVRNDAGDNVGNNDSAKADGAPNFTFGEEISVLDFTFGVANVTIEAGEKCGITTTDIDDCDIESSCGNGKFFIRQHSRIFDGGWLNVNNWGINTKMPRIVVTLPRGAMFSDVYMKFGVGSVRISGLSAKKIVISGGVGENYFEDVNLKNLKLVCGKGNISFNGSSVDGMTLLGGVGNFDFDGNLTGEKTIRGGLGCMTFSGGFGGKSEIIGGVGSIALDINDTPNDYDFIARAGVGGLSFNGRYNAFPMNPNAANKVSIRSGVGNIAVKMQ